MSNNFKKQAMQQRAAVPQIDPEGTRPATQAVPTAAPIQTPESEPTPQPSAPAEPEQKTLAAQPETTQQPPRRLTVVDRSEQPTNRGFFMYPSRHRQIAKDLAYIEDRNPWEIIEDALEEYVVKHYGKEYRRVDKSK